ncbi:MAG: PAAR domain-containing protein [Planctomycetota bacterium]|nr:PAAR domain-containing protein [Planctomycetota bacterium]
MTVILSPQDIPKPPPPPAARISDHHSCPKSEGSTPHVGGPVLGGSPNVFVEHNAAARMGDTCVCNGPPDVINFGSPTVFINGKKAARKDDTTEHGGKIEAGAAKTFIGLGDPPDDTSLWMKCLMMAADIGAGIVMQKFTDKLSKAFTKAVTK